MKNTAVLINFYKKDLTDNEIISLKRCVSILSKHDIFLVGPNDIDLEIYVKHAPNVKCHLVNSELFKGAENYTKFLLSETFYNSFLTYNRILIYQLDCYVFNDDLDYWASQDYDYIGSPFFENFEINKSKVFLGVGNGGLSLRNPRTIHFTLLKWEKLISYKKILKSGFIKRRKHKLKLTFYKTLHHLTLQRFHKPLNEILTQFPEDAFIGLVLSKEFNLLKTPPLEEALKFSMEVNSEYLFELNNKNLPFGCHAWEKHEKQFWEPYIV